MLQTEGSISSRFILSRSNSRSSSSSSIKEGGEFSDWGGFSTFDGGWYTGWIFCGIDVDGGGTKSCETGWENDATGSPKTNNGCK